jgi:hypothetical protein
MTRRHGRLSSCKRVPQQVDGDDVVESEVVLSDPGFIALRLRLTDHRPSVHCSSVPYPVSCGPKRTPLLIDRMVG